MNCILKKPMTKFFSKYKNYITNSILFIFIIVIDQVLKRLSINHLKDSDDFVLIKDVLEFHYLENNGAAFGMLKDQKAFFIIITSFFFLIILYVFIRMPLERKYTSLRLSIVVISGGAIGNFVDRVRLDHVVDFIYLKSLHFPIFNFADICVTFGSVWLLYNIIFKYKDNDLKFLSFNTVKYRTLK